MGRQLAPLFFAAFLAYGYNNIFMTLTPSFVVAAGGTLAEAGLQNSVYLAAAVLLRFAFGPAADRWGTKPVMLVGLASFVLGGAFCSRCVPSSGRCFWCAACRRSALLLSGRRLRPPCRKQRRPRLEVVGSAGTAWQLPLRFFWGLLWRSA